MKTLTLSIALLGIFIINLHASDMSPEKILERAYRYYEEEKYEDSLQDLIWFHENALKYNESLGGVRRSYALSAWVKLGKVYPKAILTLEEIRDLKISELVCGKGTSFQFADVAAINKYLEEPEITVALFKCIASKYPKLANRCYVYAKGDLITLKEFKICNIFIKDVKHEADYLREFLSASLDRYHSKTPMDKDFYNWIISVYVTDTEDIIKVLIDNDRTEEAIYFYSLVFDNINIDEINDKLSQIEKKYLANKALE